MRSLVGRSAERAGADCRMYLSDRFAERTRWRVLIEHLWQGRATVSQLRHRQALFY